MKVKNILKKIKKCRNSEDIDLEEVKAILNTNSNSLLLDVRSKQEFKEGHLNSAINIPLYELETCCNWKLKDKNTIIVIYCKSGIRSKKAIKILKKYGFNNLYNLKGGLDSI